MMTIRRLARVLPLLACVALGFGAGNSVFAAEMHTVFVPRNVIYPGDVITSDALVERQVRRDDASPAVFGENPEDLVGKVARRTLMPDQLVPHSAVHEQNVVLQGRRYKMTYNSEFLSIVGVGEALQSGAVGEMIPVRNPTSGVIVKARVEQNRTLTVDSQ
jgi:flagella basal body P-ring formation protein FlgA